jgi:N-acetylglucosaminyldiphosphoundecaprenol N-acetyl-beta-D-mannosaminyltransferase
MHNAPHMLSHNGKTNVVGTGVSALSMDATVERVLNPPADGAYVAVANVHSLMMSRSNPALAAAMADADMVTPDGMPLVWALKGMGHSDQERVHGMALATKAIERGLGSGVRHYFYGSSPATLAALESNLLASYPELALAGTYSPPFRPLTDEEAAEDAARILASGAQVVWVGLGAPKQELWMARMHPLLPGVLVGVGAVRWLGSGRYSTGSPATSPRRPTGCRRPASSGCTGCPVSPADCGAATSGTTRRTSACSGSSWPATSSSGR